uniref:Uncharacterized protein n=1 Tax=Oryza meridionalis TaxID=40149 RepID=A0A0E0C3B9_9ORYZ
MVLRTVRKSSIKGSPATPKTRRRSPTLLPLRLLMVLIRANLRFQQVSSFASFARQKVMHRGTMKAFGLGLLRK